MYFNQQYPSFLDQDNTSFIVSLVIPIALVCTFFVVVMILYLRRRRNEGRKTTKESRANDNMSLPDSVVETSRPVFVSNFAEHYRRMSADSDFR